IADPAGNRVASLAIDAVTSADMTLSIASNSAASAPNSGSATRPASMNPFQNRTGSASARSPDSQNRSPRGPAAPQPPRSTPQPARSTSWPAPADPTTTARRCSAPGASRRCSAGLLTSVGGNVRGRNFVTPKRAPGGAPRPVGELCATALPQSLANGGRATPDSLRHVPRRCDAPPGSPPCRPGTSPWPAALAEASRSRGPDG